MRFSAQTTKNLYFQLSLGVWLLLLIFFQSYSFAQTVIIPRDGFPYCEPFTNSTTRANTVFGGTPALAALTAPVDGEGNGFLQLTNNLTDQRGYVFIDLPFSSAYGIKVSFEYFAYGGVGPAYADGISFFMFDGAITPSTFQIGGLGGSLGYSPWRNNASTVTQPGLKGAYLGLGFDAFRNWGNEYEGRYGGFKGSTLTGFGPVPDERQYYNSIAIRGPETSNYQFIDGRRTFSRSFLNEEQPAVWLDPIDPNYYLFNSLPPLEYIDRRFTIGSASRAELCSESGYRKVFVDLAPTGTGTYLLTVNMLVNNGGTLRLENIFTNVPYNFPAFKNLKIGFAASTGTPYTNFHEIRNVTAQVSDYAAIPLPEIKDEKAEVCIGDQNLFEFDVTLTSENSFVRCVQLYPTNPGPPDNTPPSGGDPSISNCGLSNVCIEKCNPLNNSITIPGKGTFTVELEELTTGNFETEKFKAKVKFVPVPGFVGEAQIYYQVLDNYGLLSEPKTITVVSNPLPALSDSGDIDYPSCDGQDDGRIFGVQFVDLVAGFDYNWTYTDVLGAVFNLGKTGASVVNSGSTATFELKNINLGTYTLTVSNPSITGGCPESVDIVVDQELGTPVTLTTPDKIICEGDDVSFVPVVNNPSGASPQFLWYTAADRTGGALTNGTRTIDGATVQVTIAANGQLTLDGLTSAGATPKLYDFFVETNNLNVASGNFCPYLGNVLSKATVQVYPPLGISATDQEDWCLTSTGSITASTTGLATGITFTLLNSSGNTIATNSSGNFTGLAKGDYQVYATSATPSCTSIILPVKIEGPAAPLALTPVSLENSYCGIANGSLKFNLLGGNLPYSITINGNPLSSPVINGNEYTLNNLAAGTYIIRVVDGKGCPAQITQVIAADLLSQFGTTKDETCEGETAILAPTIVNLSSSVPIYKWYYKDGGGNYVQITNGLNLSGVTFSIDGSNKLSVSNLAPQATPYTYYLNVTGTKVCDQGYIPAEILVNPKPIPSTPIITQVTCNGAANGVIQAQLASGNPGDFEYSLIGNNGVNKSFTKNSGLFNNLSPGTYELIIKSAKGCEVSVANVVITEPSELLLNQVSKTDATCALNNGIIRFTATGATPDGTGKYIIKVNGADISTLGSNLTQNGPADFTLSNLAPGNYQIDTEDIKGCKKTLTITVLNTPIPVFDAQDITVCEGTNAVLTPQVVSNTIGAIPVYTWSYENPSSPGQYIQINNGDVDNGVTYTLSNGILTIKGLKYAVANYKYYLSVTGTNVCPAAPIQAEVKVLKIPTAVFETIAVSCFGGTNGQIKLTSVDPAGPNTFTLVETGASNSTGNFSNLKAGTYTIRIKETGSPCQSEFQVIIVEPAKLELLNPLKSDPTCNQINGSVSFDVKGGVKDYQILINGKPIADYSFAQTGDRYEVKNLAPGSYSVQITDANACVLNQPNLFVLINDDGLTVTINPLEDEKCVGSSAILNPVFASALPVVPTLKWYKDAGLIQPITSSPTPDSDNITYQINPSGALTITGLQVGDYKYFLEISGPGICTLVEEANVKILPQIVADIVVDDITCFGQKDGLITVTPSGGNGKFEIRLNEGAYSANKVYSNLAPGKYAVDIRNDIGCVTSYQVEVKGPAGPVSINKPSIIRASCDLDNGSIEDLVISGGWNSYAVEWRFGSVTGAIIPGDLTGAKNLGPGTYFLLVSDLEGCKATFTFVIEESSDPVYAVVPPINSCLGTKVSIRPIHLAPNPSLPPAAATEIRWYTGPDQTGLISNGADPSITGVTYTIDDTDWLNPLLEIEGLPVGLHDFYFFVVCTGQEIKIETTVFSTPEVTFETDPITCFGDKNGKIRVISGDQPVYTYSVNSAVPLSRSALEAMSFSAGTYNIVIATPAGCSQDLNLTIDGPSSALASSPLTKIDPGCGAPNGKLELVVTGGWLPYTLDISKDGASIGTQVFSQSDILIDGFTQGVYQINITDSEGCTVTTNSVTMIDGPTQILIDEEAICEGSNAVLVPSLDPVASGASFQWFFNKALTLPVVSSPSPAADGNIYQIDPSTGVLTVSGLDASPTDYTYYVTVAGSTICEGFIGEGKVRVYGNPAASSSVQNEVCYGEGGQITVNASGGSGSYTYSLNGGAFVTSNVFNVSTGTYNVEVRTPEGCSHIVSDIIVSGPSGALAVKDIEQNNPTCELNNGDFRFTISGGYPPYTINYTKNSVSAGTSSAAPDGSVLISGIGVGTYAFTVTDKQGCKINLPNSFVFTEVPTEITAADDEICAGETAELIPSVSKNIINPQFSWYFDTQGNNPVNSGTINGVTYAIAPSGAMTISGLAPNASGHIFYVSATGQGICGLVPKQVKVNVNGIPNLKVSNPSVVCDPNGSVDLTNFIEGFNPAIYDYSVLNPSGSVMRLEDIDAVQVSGDYRVSSSLKGKSCWNQTQRIRVIISDTLLEALFEYQIDLGGGLIVNNGDIQIEELVQFDDLSKGKIILWEWNFGDGSTSADQNPTHIFQAKGAYTVTLRTIDEFGCESIYQMVVTVLDDYKVMVPNAFTPDGAKNKYFKPYYRGISSMEFYIFNTWGELIYESKSLEDTGWDGTLNGTPTPNGNYVYKGRFVSRSGEVFTKSGVFILIR